MIKNAKQFNAIQNCSTVGVKSFNCDVLTIPVFDKIWGYFFNASIFAFLCVKACKYCKRTVVSFTEKIAKRKKNHNNNNKNQVEIFNLLI